MKLTPEQVLEVLRRLQYAGMDPELGSYDDVGGWYLNLKGRLGACNGNTVTEVMEQAAEYVKDANAWWGPL